MKFDTTHYELYGNLYELDDSMELNMSTINLGFGVYD